MNRLGCSALRYTSRIPVRRKARRPGVQRRDYTTSPVFHKRDDASRPPKKKERETWNFDIKGLDPEARAIYKSLTPDQRKEWEEEAKQFADYMTSAQVDSALQGEASLAAHEAAEAMPHVDVQIPRIKSGLMAMGEVEPQDSGEDEEFEGDDITSLAHGELEQHREMRHYARIAAWEMPLLSKLATPFVIPSKDEPLRFRYTTYMGETHPAEKKVVLEFCTRDLRSLTEPQRIKLIKLVGARYNPQTDIVKMSSEMFETQAQNKRYLGDLVDTLMAEARDGGDMFEDVPLDFRHHKVESRPEFPAGWKLNQGRKAQLEAERRERAEEESRREQMGMVVTGASIIEMAMLKAPVVDESRVLVEAQQGKRGQAKGKGRPMLR